MRQRRDTLGWSHFHAVEHTVGADDRARANPRTLPQDQAKLEAAGCHLLFAPAVEEMYPADQDQWVKVVVNQVTRHHCGAARPGHFDGVSTVVSKLFNIVQPDVALFGKKDFQQLAVIKRMTTALCFPVQVIGIDTVREASGLAMSSRNGYLSADELQRASALYRTLCATRDAIIAGDRDYAALAAKASHELAQAGFEPEYFNLSRAEDLEPATAEDKNLVILAAARLGRARLIDNIDFHLP